MENDEEGFYSRLGFAIIDEHVLNVEYKFSEIIHDTDDRRKYRRAY